MDRLLRFGLAPLAACAVALPLAAQQPDTTHQDTVRVDSAPAYTLPPIEVITSIVPFAGPRIGSGVPARISTFTGQEIDAWEPRTLADALGSQAGVSMYDDLGSPYKLNLSTRGFNVGPVVGLPPGVSVFLDGVRQNEPDAAQVNFDLLPLEHVKRIELLSGSGSLLGPNSLGGAVNLITRRGEGPLDAELEVSGGSFDTYSAEGSVAGASRGWDYYVAGGYERARGWRQATVGKNYNVFANVGRLGPTRGVSFQAFGATSYAETAGSLPESIFGTAPRTNFTAGDFEDLDLLQFTVTGYAPLGRTGGGGRSSFTLYHRQHNAERFNVNQAPDPDVRGFSRNRTLGGNLDWQWGGRLGGRDVSLRAGLDGARNSVNIRLIEEDPADPATDTLTTDVDSPSWDLAGYATADLRLGRLTLSAGLRYDYIVVPFEDNLDPTADTSSSFRRWSPRGGLSVALGRGALAYASLGQSFRAPAVLELACADETAACPLPFALGDDPPLDPVVGTTYELGARWPIGRITLDGAVYRTDVQDDISFIASDAAVYAGYFANIGSTRREGVELSAQAQLRGGHTLYANYGYTRASFRTEAETFSIRADSAYVASPLFGENAVEVGDRLPLVPEHQMRFGAAVALGAGFEAGVDGRYTGRQWLRGDEANETGALDGYFTADLRLAWERERWSVAAVASNVFDSQRAVFGTFNQNRQTGELERFLTPLNARAFRVIVRRGFGARG
jgi:outer membrane receptor protein involved in Fe transport